MKTPPTKIKKKLKKISSDFDLDYNPPWFNYSWISKKQEILSEFLSDCTDKIYLRYGKSINQRLKNLDVFVSSKDFNKCTKRYGGQVYKSENLRLHQKLLSGINNPWAKHELSNLISLAKKSLRHSDFLVLLTRTTSVKEREFLLGQILFHEWIHIILFKNGICFQKKGLKYWQYDEGLNEYLAAYVENRLNSLEKKRDTEKYPHERKYYLFAIKFRNWLEDCHTPRERKSKIQKIYKNLK